jgi:phosphopantetheine--protein transferase-like protein
VDVDPEIGPPVAAKMVVDELAGGDGALEVFRDEGIRRVVMLATESIPEQGAKLEGNPVIAITGGTRGITAQVAKELASRGPCKLALIARTPPATEPLDEDAARKQIRAELNRSGQRVTPVQVKRRMVRLQSADEARQNIEAMRALGAEVEFFSVDTSDADAVMGAMMAIEQKLGPIGGVIHGAGIEESRLIDAKQLADFHRIFDCKAIGGVTLAENLGRLSWFVSMGSVAGRFGNPGQVDYSAANDGMARICLARPRSLHIDWTAWADVGMAVRGGMERLLTDRGVELLPADAGAGLLVDMILAGVTGELLVAGKLGDFTMPATHPLLDRVELDGDGAVGRRSLSLSSDSWILDHAIEGTPVLPGVIGLELMAAVARTACPGQIYMGAIDVAFKAPVKLHRDATVDLIIRAEPVGPDRVRCSLGSERKARTGRLLQTEHFEATILLGEPEPVEPLIGAGLDEDGFEHDAIYRRFFHGPGFQVLRAASGVNLGGLFAEARVNHKAIGYGLETLPLILESAFQAAGLHTMIVDGRMALPKSIHRVQLLSPVADGQELDLVVLKRGDVFDVDVDGPNGPVLRLRGFEMIETGPLPDGDRFEIPEGGWSEGAVARIGGSASGPGPQGWLPAEEVAEISRRGTPKRQKDRRMGRLAGRMAIEQLTGWAPQQYRIQSLDSGQPVVHGPEHVAVSISHGPDGAVGLAVRSGQPGIDMERIELRSPSFARTWFTPSEARISGDDPRLQTRIWCVKEAVLKALGTGMRLHPREVEICELRPRRATVHLHGEAAQIHQRLGGGALLVQISEAPGLVIATVVIIEGTAENAALGSLPLRVVG